MESLNRGNFLEILALIAKKDTVIQKKLRGAQNQKYTSPEIQNELLDVMASRVRKSISDEVQGAGCLHYLWMRAKMWRERNNLRMLRYVHNNEICEAFLDFVEPEGLNAKSLLNAIKGVLNAYQVDMSRCVGQSYDGAAVMRETCKASTSSGSSVYYLMMTVRSLHRLHPSARLFLLSFQE
eukprot:Pompholyxophrys_sp_v1_NODE_231_length_1038_cov_1160.985758.p1 type:complete len:181 gc:universal NODE_231_length_1038_cov_1160.985758:764-222(-)